MSPVPALCLVASAAFGQAFEAATIKPNHSGSPEASTYNYPGRVVATNQTLASYLTQAFEIRDYQLSGPKWLESDRYDLNAKLPAGAERKTAPAMLRTLLIERFKIEFHRDTKEMPAFGLVAGKNGARVQSSREAGSSTSMGPYLFRGKKIPLTRLAEHLSNILGRPVLDLTDLTGEYDIDLKWAAEDQRAEMAAGPSLVTALQEQLGLRLESRKAPIPILVIDRMERVPAGN